MPRTPRSATRAPRADAPSRSTPQAGRAEVIVDFVFDDGLLFISVENIGERPAFNVTVCFDQPLIGVHGTREISALPLFRNIEFLAPHKAIVTFLDTSAAYFSSGQPTKIAAQVSYLDAERTRHDTRMHHDIGIYRDIGYVRRSDGAPRNH